MHHAVTGDNIAKSILTLIGFTISIIGLANVLPTYNIFPRIGPFPVEWFRPLFYWLCLIAFLVSDFHKRQKTKPIGGLQYIIYSVALLASTYICFDYWIIGQILTNSVMFFGSREALLATIIAILSLWACWQLWGAPIAMLGGIAFIYLVTGQYWPGPLQTVPSDLYDTLSVNIWYDSAQGILGSIMGVVLTTVLPFIILGAILEGCGASGSMIRISFHLMKRFRGGPAYAAVLASALFGTVSGSAVANVVGTGVVTIPMIRKRGFSPNFAGAVEASASTGGQILPPIMGAAALIMADIVGVSYLTVVLAVIIPAIAYYASLFLAVLFEAQKLGVQVSNDEEIQIPTTQDWLNMLLVFAPIAIIIYLLVNGQSAAGASIAAILILFPLSFINPNIRKYPTQLLLSISNGGKTIAQLAIAIAIVGIVVSTLSATGIPTKFSVMLTQISSSSLIFGLGIAAIGCIILGMGMPTLPAYIAIIAVMGPTLQGLGVELLTAHMFVFMFGVAAGITPPVAITAYAAASVSGGKPIGTAIEATRIGAMIFIIPFAFGYNPALLLGTESSKAADPTFILASIIGIVIALYLLASALVGSDRGKLHPIERGLRLIVAFLCMTPPYQYFLIGITLSVGLIGWRYITPFFWKAEKHD